MIKTNDNGLMVEILLIEDDPGDVRLTLEAFKDGRICNHLSVVRDGVDAMHFLKRSGEYSDAVRPDLILLDLNLPRKDGREVLAEIKADPGLKNIPVVVLTTSADDFDINRAYDLHVNCYITKPVDFEQFMRVVHTLKDYWLTIVKLPRSA